MENKLIPQEQNKHINLVQKKQSRPLLATLKEDNIKIRDNTSVKENDFLINYLVTIMNLKVSNDQEKEALNVQMLVVTDFIKTKFGFLTIPEVKEAFKMFIAKEFEGLKVFRMLDCIVVGDVLNAFVNFRTEKLRIYEKKRKQLLIKQPVMNDEKKTKLSKQAVNKSLSFFLENGIVDESRIFIYDLLFDLDYLPKDKKYKESILKDAKDVLERELLSKKATNMSEKRDFKIALKEVQTTVTGKVIRKCKELVLFDFFRTLQKDETKLKEFKEAFGSEDIEF